MRITREYFRATAIPVRIHTVGDGEGVLPFLRWEGPYAVAPRSDLIILDLNLSGKDGRDVLKEVKTDPNLCGIAMVVLSSSASNEDLHYAYRSHANSYLQKSVDFAQLRAAINGLLEYWFMVVTLSSSQVT